MIIGNHRLPTAHSTPKKEVTGPGRCPLTVRATLCWCAAVALLSMIVIVLLGLSVHKDHGYEYVEQERAWGSINVRLLGNDRYIDNRNTIRGSPYNLMVSATFSNAFSEKFANKCVVTFGEITLTGTGHMTPEFSDKQSIAIARKNYLGIMVASYGTGQIHLNFQDYKLHGKLSFSAECGGIPELEFNMTLARKYTEEIITFFDRLMGI